MAASLDHEAQGPIQLRELVGTEPIGLAFPQPDPDHPVAVLDLVVQRHRITPNVKSAGECFQAFTCRLVYHRGRIDQDAGSHEVVPAAHLLQCVQHQTAKGWGRDSGQCAARSTP